MYIIIIIIIEVSPENGQFLYGGGGWRFEWHDLHITLIAPI